MVLNLSPYRMSWLSFAATMTLISSTKHEWFYLFIKCFKLLCLVYGLNSKDQKGRVSCINLFCSLNKWSSTQQAKWQIKNINQTSLYLTALSKNISPQFRCCRPYSDPLQQDDSCVAQLYIKIYLFLSWRADPPCWGTPSWPEWSMALKSPWCCASRRSPAPHRVAAGHSRWTGRRRNTHSCSPVGTRTAAPLPALCP